MTPAHYRTSANVGDVWCRCHPFSSICTHSLDIALPLRELDCTRWEKLALLAKKRSRNGCMRKNRLYFTIGIVPATFLRNIVWLIEYTLGV